VFAGPAGFKRTSPATPAAAGRPRSPSRARAAVRKSACRCGGRRLALAGGSPRTRARTKNQTPSYSCLRHCRYVRLRCDLRSCRNTDLDSSRTPGLHRRRQRSSGQGQRAERGRGRVPSRTSPETVQLRPHSSFACPFNRQGWIWDKVLESCMGPIGVLGNTRCGEWGAGFQATYAGRFLCRRQAPRPGGRPSFRDLYAACSTSPAQADSGAFRAGVRSRLRGAGDSCGERAARGSRKNRCASTTTAAVQDRGGCNLPS